MRQPKSAHKKHTALIVAKQNLLQLAMRAKEEHLYFYQKIKIHTLRERL